VLAIINLVIWSSIFVRAVNGQSTEQDLNQTIDQQSTELIQSCSTVFDTVNIGSIYSKICASIMDSINDQCRDNYFVFCFGQAWINYEDNHKAYGSSSKHNKKCVVFEDNSHTGNCSKKDLKPWNCHKQGNKICGIRKK
jgi:hypothetical protein